MIVVFSFSHSFWTGRKHPLVTVYFMCVVRSEYQPERDWNGAVSFIVQQDRHTHIYIYARIAIINFTCRFQVSFFLFSFLFIFLDRYRHFHSQHISHSLTCCIEIEISIKPLNKIGSHQFLFHAITSAYSLNWSKPSRPKPETTTRALKHCKCISWLDYFHYLVVSRALWWL